jgi:hypothetical protein
MLSSYSTAAMKKWIAIWMLGGLLLCNIAQAQEEFVEPPARLLTQFPFQVLTGGVIILRAQFADFPDTLNFILDTGSGGISLDSLTAVYFNLHPVPSDKTIRGIAGIRKVSFVMDQKLTLPGLLVQHLNFHINDYGILTSVYGERIDGIIGFSFLSRYIVWLDYDNYQMYVYSQGTMKLPRGGYLLRPVINMLPVQPLRVRDNTTVSTRFLYDMGAGLNMMLSKDFVEDSSFLSPRKKIFNKEAEGLGGKIDISMMVIKELKLGPYKFRRIPAYLFDDVNNITNYPYLGGILGNDILRRFNVILNYERRSFYLMPNSHFNESFDYSYTGLELYWLGGLIVVGDVAKDSPAEKAGLKEGDIVLGVNKDFTQNFGAYKTAMQATGEKIKITIRRDTDILQYEFKVKSIL